jgi:hypothetical protein
MYLTIKRALSNVDSSLSRGSHPKGCEEWVVTGIADDMISIKSDADERINIEIKHPAEAMNQVFEAVKITPDGTRKQIERSQSFAEVWSTATDQMD